MCLIALIVHLTGLEKIQQQFSQLVVSFFLFAILIENIGVALSAKKWQLLFKLKDINVPFPTALKYYYIGSFFNAFLPTSIGGDAVKAYNISKELDKKEEAFSSVVMDRISGLIAVLSIGSLALTAGWQVIPSDVIIVCLPILAIPVLLLILFFKTNIIGVILRKPFFIKFGKLHMFVEKIYSSLKDFSTHKRGIAVAFFISCCYHILLILNNYILSLALGLDIPLYFFFIVIPIAEILVFLPVSIQGFGVREGTYVTLFSPFATNAQSFALGFSNQIVKVIGSVIGGIVYIVTGIHVKKN
jgi:uncharacterized protein (TIRG00374 family)